MIPETENFYQIIEIEIKKLNTIQTVLIPCSLF